MKVKFDELQNDFWLSLEAETMQEAATLARFGLNGRQVAYRATNVGDKGTFTTELSFHKTERNATSCIQPQAWRRKK